VRNEDRPTGHLEKGPISQQLSQYAGLLGKLEQRMAAVKARGLPKGFVLHVDPVQDFFGSEDVKDSVLAWIRKEVLTLREYNASPSLAHRNAASRLEAFTREEEAPERSNRDPMGIEPQRRGGRTEADDEVGKEEKPRFS
jgi:hypothetical protein